MIRLQAVRRIIGPAALASIVLGVIAFVRSRARFDRKISTLIEDLSADSDAAVHAEESKPGIALSSDDLDTLPPPVERYLTTVFQDDQRHIESVRLDQRGEFRFEDSSTAWKPLRATQHVVVQPPGFVWDATIELVPYIPVRVIDAYVGGEGRLEARLLSAIPVADAEPGPEMNTGELLRYLGESVWYPTALRSEMVEWQEIDDRAARATIDHGGTSASLIFRFDEHDHVASVHAEERYRQEVDTMVPWTGYFRDYRERDGLLIPFDAKVEWNLPEGDYPYWRAKIETIEFGFTDG